MDLKKRKIVIAIMVAMFLGAVEGTVVTTAIPTIVRDLNGFELISWIFSVYLLTSAISTPIYGKLSDLYGRKNVLCIGIVIFLIGSCLCGLAQNMYVLIAFRAIQGLGAGSIFTVTYTIVGDIFTLTERAKVQGWVSTTWGIASLIGPFLGGFLIDYLSWHWIFFINVPFGILSIILLKRNLNESFEVKKHKIDYAGTIALSIAIISLLYGVLAGTKNAVLVIASLLLAAIFLVIFYFVEKRAEEPIVPFEIFSKSNAVINIISFLASAVLMGADVYLPIYMQSVLGFSATISGVSMAPMSLSWLLASVILAKAILKHGEKVVIAFSTIILLLSCMLLLTLKVNSPLILVIIYAFIMGFGFGGSFNTMTIIVQSSVDYSKRGAATACNSLLRTLGQTIGISVFGSMFNLNILKYFNTLGVRDIELNNLYSIVNKNTAISLEKVKIAINSGVQVIFIASVIITAVCLLLSFTISSELKEKDGYNIE